MKFLTPLASGDFSLKITLPPFLVVILNFCVKFKHAKWKNFDPQDISSHLEIFPKDGFYCVNTSYLPAGPAKCQKKTS